MGGLGIRVRSQVAARDAARHEPLDLRIAHAHDALAEGEGELRVGREVGHESLHHTAHQRRAEHIDRGADEGQQLRAGLAELGQLDDLLDHVEDDRQRELVLVAPAAVDRRLGHARARRDALDGETVDAALDEQLARRLEDRELGRGAARPPAAARRRPGVEVGRGVR